ncbi:hypothetical protein FWH09_02015 [Candidatus Saccharibacteria bacterium]|nr:hypothetical protein [Candidatus Saccharibacteria bacterium]
METPLYILIIMLSVVLIVFLIVAIILGVQLLKLTKQIQGIAGTASKIADDAKGVADNIRSITTPAAIGVGIATAIDKIRSSVHNAKSEKAEGNGAPSGEAP